MSKLSYILVVIFGLLSFSIFAFGQDKSEPEEINEYDKWRFEYTNMDLVWPLLEDIPYQKGQSNEVIVAIIDTGVDTNHPDLNIIAGYDFGDKDTEPMDVQGHGTHVAGIVGAKKNFGNDQVVGIAPGIQVLPIKVFANAGYALNKAIADGIDYAIDKKADVINISFADYYNQDIAEAMERAESAGIVVVASTSNDSNHWLEGEAYHQKYNGVPRKSDVVLFPAALDTVLSVGSVRKHPSKDELGISDFSNIGGMRDGKYRSVDVVAPGSYIKSTNLRDDNVARIMSGTSMAAPHVTGAVALLRGKYPFLSPSQIRDIIRKTAYDPGIVIPEGYNRKDTIGHGLLDIHAALNFSPLDKLITSEPVGFSFESQKYNYLINVEKGIDELTFSGDMMHGATFIYEDTEYSTINDVRVPIKDGITVFEFKVKMHNVEKSYKFFVKHNQIKDDNRVSRIVITTSGLNPSIIESNMDYYITFNQDISEVSYKVETKSTEDVYSIITLNNVDEGNSPGIPQDITLDEKTKVIGIKVSGQGKESMHMIAFIKNEKPKSTYTQPTGESEPIVSTSRVTLELDTDAIVLDYGPDADPNLTSYKFQAKVRGASKNDVVWSLDDDEFVNVDKDGVVTARDNIPEDKGDFSVTLTAQTVVGGQVAKADILFVEKTPLGAIEYFLPYISGYEDKTFRPQKAITRAEVATIFSKIMNLRLVDSAYQHFVDVDKSHWAYQYVEAMYRTRLFSGYDDKTFKPNAPISRAEIAQVISNYWKYYDVEIDKSHTTNIPDVDSAYWAADAIHRLYNAKVDLRYINNVYRPLDDTKREELVYMINRILDRQPSEKETSKFTDVDVNYFFHGDIEAASDFYFKPIKDEE